MILHPSGLVMCWNVFFLFLFSSISVTYLHKTSLMSPFLHVELKKTLCRVQSVLQIGENQKSILLFYPKLWNFENSENIKS